MIDYILRFTNEAAAKAALPEWLEWDEDSNSFWKAKPLCGIIETKVTGLTGGFFLLISCPDVDEIIYGNSATVMEIQRPYNPRTIADCIIRKKITDADIAAITMISPDFSGSAYIWGA